VRLRNARVDLEDPDPVAPPVPEKLHVERVVVQADVDQHRLGARAREEYVEVKAVTHVEERRDEEGKLYRSTADDAVYATFRLDDDIVVHFNSSWVVRVRRDDLLTIQVDGSRGSAVAGLRDCWIQPAPATPRPVWNPDLAGEIRYRDDWLKLPDQREYENAFRAQWVLFLRHLVCDEPFPWDVLEGARGVQLAERVLEASGKREWLDLPDLTSDSRS